MIKQPGRMLAIIGGLLGAAVASPRAASAQAKAELTPFLGSFYAVTKFCTDCFKNGSDLKGRQLNSPVFGGRVTVWASRTVGVEGAFSYTSSRIQIYVDSSGQAAAFSAPAHLLLASGRLLFRPQRTNLHFIVGGGIVNRGGDLWKLAHDSAGTKRTSFAGVLGLGVRAAVTPKFALIVSAEGNFYSFDPKFGPPGDESNGTKLQSDLVVSVGVPITLSR